MSEILRDGTVYIFSEEALEALSRDCIAFGMSTLDAAVLNMYCTDYITLK